MKILHILSALDNGGVERMLINYLNNMDLKDIQCDFIVHGKKEGKLEQTLKLKGSKVYHVTPKKESLLQNMKEIDKVIKNGNYDVVHCHQNFSSFTSLWIAKKNKVKTRIVHSHGCNPAKTMRGKVKEAIFRKLNKWNANYFFACGQNAAKWLYGEKWEENQHNIIMPNAIEINEFKYNSEIREEYRKKLGISSNEIVLLHVGRFSMEKNHSFLIKLIKEINEKKDRVYKLILVGSGELENSIKEEIQNRKVEDRVILLGNSNCVYNIMSMSDIFLLPSKHEGLGIVTIEAQANGLPVICSNNISKEVVLTDLVKFIAIDSTEEWKEEIIETINFIFDNKREKYNEILENTDYNIQNQSLKYRNWIKNIEKGVN